MSPQPHRSLRQRRQDALNSVAVDEWNEATSLYDCCYEWHFRRSPHRSLRQRLQDALNSVAVDEWNEATFKLVADRDCIFCCVVDNATYCHLSLVIYRVQA